MKRVAAISAAIVALAMAAPAWAAKTFVLDNVTLQGGGTLTGTFTTDDTLKSLLGINITSSGAGAFSAFNYNNAALADWVSLPSQGFRIQTSGGAQELRLDFFPLTSSGASLLRTSYEHQGSGGNRTVLGGSVSLQTAPVSAVPEPATWAMMIIGFGAVGSMVRTTRRRNVFSAA